jgi:hypothetical protein
LTSSGLAYSYVITFVDLPERNLDHSERKSV